jgi:hypothetical protein
MILEIRGGLVLAVEKNKKFSSLDFACIYWECQIFEFSISGKRIKGRFEAL